MGAAFFFKLALSDAQVDTEGQQNSTTRKASQNQNHCSRHIYTGQYLVVAAGGLQESHHGVVLEFFFNQNLQFFYHWNFWHV